MYIIICIEIKQETNLMILCLNLKNKNTVRQEGHKNTRHIASTKMKI